VRGGGTTASAGVISGLVLGGKCFMVAIGGRWGCWGRFCFHKPNQPGVGPSSNRMLRKKGPELQKNPGCSGELGLGGDLSGIELEKPSPNRYEMKICLNRGSGISHKHKKVGRAKGRGGPGVVIALGRHGADQVFLKQNWGGGEGGGGTLAPTVDGARGRGLNTLHAKNKGGDSRPYPVSISGIPPNFFFRPGNFVQQGLVNFKATFVFIAGRPKRPEISSIGNSLAPMMCIPTGYVGAIQFCRIKKPWEFSVGGIFNQPRGAGRCGGERNVRLRQTPGMRS